MHDGRHPAARLLLALLALSALLAVRPAVAAGLPGGKLGEWLETTAAPELAREFANHPRYRGETLGFADPDSALTEAIGARLSEHLRGRDGVRLEWTGRAEPCRRGKAPPYRIQVSARPSGDDHRVTIAVADVDEGLWVSGISLTWEGRLTRAARDAFEHAPIALASTHALPLDADRIATALAAEAACRFPRGPEGGLRIDTAASDPLMRAVLENLAVALSARAWRLVVDPATAQWTLRLARARGDGGGSFELLAFDAAERPLSLASVATAPAGPSVSLLGDLDLAPAGNAGICRGERARCAEVGFALEQPAYLVVFSTAQGNVTSLSCGRVRETSAGDRRYRLRAEPAGISGRPDAGFYVLATADAKLAKRIAGAVNDAPGACGGAGRKDWFAPFSELVAAHEARLDWRALHLHAGAAGLARL